MVGVLKNICYGFSRALTIYWLVCSIIGPHDIPGAQERNQVPLWTPTIHGEHFMHKSLHIPRYLDKVWIKYRTTGVCFWLSTHFAMVGQYMPYLYLYHYRMSTQNAILWSGPQAIYTRMCQRPKGFRNIWNEYISTQPTQLTQFLHNDQNRRGI
jgi:hypothetical protein